MGADISAPGTHTPLSQEAFASWAPKAYPSKAGPYSFHFLASTPFFLCSSTKPNQIKTNYNQIIPKSFANHSQIISKSFPNQIKTNQNQSKTNQKQSKPKPKQITNESTNVQKLIKRRLRSTQRTAPILHLLSHSPPPQIVGRCLGTRARSL